MFTNLFAHINHHVLGNIGSLLMLSGTIYSLKKHLEVIPGHIGFWLKHHEVVSVLGGILVIIHMNGSLRGLAGLSAILMIIILISGFLGHYIYTRIPRTKLGKEKALAELKKELRVKRSQLNDPASPDKNRSGDDSAGSEARATSARSELPQSPYLLIKDDLNERKRIGKASDDKEKLEFEIQRLERKIRQIDTARRFLSSWRSWHIPLTIIFLITVIIHIISTLYFGNYFG